MATFTKYLDGRPVVASGGGNAAGYPAVTVIQNTFDASRLPLDAADVVEVLNVPAGTFVHKVFVEVLNGETGQTLNVGDGTDPDGYVAAAAVATDGVRLMGGGAYSAGKFYAEADTIDVAVPATMAYDTLRVRVVASVTAIG